MIFTEIAQKLTETFQSQFSEKKASRKWQSLTDGLKSAIDNNNETGRGRSRFAFLSEMDLLGDRPNINFVVTANSSNVTIHRPDDIGYGSRSCSSGIDEYVSDELVPPITKVCEPDRQRSEGAQRSFQALISKSKRKQPASSTCSVGLSQPRVSKCKQVPPSTAPSDSLDDLDSENDPSTSSNQYGGQKKKRKRRNAVDDEPFLKYLKQSDSAAERRDENMLAETRAFNRTFQEMMNKLIDKM